MLSDIENTLFGGSSITQYQSTGIRGLLKKFGVKSAWTSEELILQGISDQITALSKVIAIAQGQQAKLLLSEPIASGGAPSQTAADE